MRMSVGRYNEFDNATHITGGAMFGPDHVHIVVHGPCSQSLAERIVSMWNTDRDMADNYALLMREQL